MPCGPRDAPGPDAPRRCDLTLTERLAAAFDPDPLVEAVSLWLPNLLAALVTIVGFTLVGRILQAALTALSHRTHMDPTVLSLLRASTRLALLVLAAVTVLSQLGIDVTGLVAGLGVAGLTVGFAARDTLSNIISGVFIFWDRPFVIGDLVEVDGNYGRVDAITLRSTRIVTVDGRMLAFPNTTVANTMVASYTNFPHLRIDVDVTVDVNSDIGQCRRVMLQQVRDRAVWMDDPAPVVAVTELGDYFVRLELRAWLHDERSHIDRRVELRENIFEAFRREGIDMPYETIELRPVVMRSEHDA